MTADQGGASPRGLLVDFGGVLTTSVGRSFRDFEQAEGLPKGTIFEILVTAYTETDEDHPLARLERGESSADEFEQALAAELRAQGHELTPGDLHERLFAGVRPVPEMWELVRHARDAGVRTGLLSNSWGAHEYPGAELDAHFDVRVISGEVGLRKPDPAIYELACERLGVPADRCAFVDDVQRNVDAAADLGLFAIHHRGVAATRAALESFLEVPLG